MNYCEQEGKGSSLSWTCLWMSEQIYNFIIINFFELQEIISKHHRLLIKSFENGAVQILTLELYVF